MSMPEITLFPIDPRSALASVIASIALQEAAVSHVLNAEGEKIQAVVGMDDVTVETLQDINASVAGTMDSVALLEDTLQNKLRTALHALYPTATFTIHFVDSLGASVNCQCVLCTLTGPLPGGPATTLHAIGDALTLTGLRPGSYTLEMDAACEGYEINGTIFPIVVDIQGNATFNGNDVDEIPPEIVLTEDGSRMAAPASAQALVAAPVVAAQETVSEPVAAPTVDQYIISTLTNRATGDASTVYPDGDTLTLTRPEPGSYTLRVIDVYAGYARSEKQFEINVCAAGNVRCNGILVTDASPAVIELADVGSLVLHFE